MSVFNHASLVATIVNECSDLFQVDEMRQVAEKRYWELKGRPRPTMMEDITALLDMCTSEQFAEIIEKAKTAKSLLDSQDAKKQGEIVAEDLSARIGAHWVNLIDQKILNQPKDKCPNLHCYIASVPGGEQIREAIVHHYNSKGYIACAFRDGAVQIEAPFNRDAMLDAMEKAAN